MAGLPISISRMYAPVTLHFRRPLNTILVPLEIDGKTLHFFVDTGHPTSFCRDKSIPHIPAQYTAVGEDFRLNPQPWYIQLKELEQLFGCAVDGFLGADFFGQRNIEIDFVAQSLILNAPKPAWTPEHQLPLQEWSVPISYCDRPEEPWFIDTGSKLCFRWKDLHDGPQSPNHRFPSVHGPARFDLIANGRFSFDDQLLGTATIAKPHVQSPSLAGIIGQNLLSQFHCYFDRQDGLLWLKRNHHALESWMDYSVEQYTPGFQVVSRVDIDPSGALLEVAHHTHPETARLAVGTQFRLGSPSLNSAFSINAAYSALYSCHASQIALIEEGQQDIRLFPVCARFASQRSGIIPKT